MFKPILTSLVILLMATAVSAQPARQNKPVPKPAQAQKSEDKTEQAASRFDAGQRAHETGDLAKAVELYGQALELDPELWQAEFQRGAAYFSLNKLVEAKASMMHVNQLLAEYPVTDQLKQIFARVQTTLGEIALAESKLDEAEKAFARVLELNPQSARAHSGLAEIHYNAGKYAEAIAEAKAAIAAGDDHAATLMLLGVALTVTNKFDEALPALNEAVKRDSKNATALLYRAEVFIAQNKPNEAAADLRAALAIEPNTRTKLRLAALLAQTKQFDAAVVLFQEVVNAEPANADARTGLTAALIDSGKAADAVGELEHLIKAEPNRAVLRAQLAELLLPKQPEKALEQYRAAAELEPKNANHQVGLASALVKLRKFQEAVDVLKPVLASNPTGDVEYFARTNLATALFELDDFPNAAREFLWILDHQAKRGDRKRTAITLFFVGVCLDKLGDFEQALRAYNQFLELASPDNQLEIDKVKLRLPSLKHQIEIGQGKKKKG
ncbi:MAG: tetratricopeptide repeat protein [Acidobacteria bacterium]|nr:tetratricopeptide repeat protein [Acidobacteriota bacterium]